MGLLLGGLASVRAVGRWRRARDPARPVVRGAEVVVEGASGRRRGVVLPLVGARSGAPERSWLEPGALRVVVEAHGRRVQLARLTAPRRSLPHIWRLLVEAGQAARARRGASGAEVPAPLRDLRAQE